VLDMHRLVHFATRIWIGPDGSAAATRRAALKHLSKGFPWGDYANREIWRAYLPHMARIDKGIQGEEGEERSKLCLKVGLCLCVDGRQRKPFYDCKRLVNGGRQISHKTIPITYHRSTHSPMRIDEMVKSRRLLNY
jgi:hypothetical protein